MAGVIYDNQSYKGSTGLSGDSLSHVGAGGASRYAVFTLHRTAGSGGNPPAPTTVTYDGVPMTQVANRYIASHRRSCVYVLAGFNVGTKTVAWTSTYANWYTGTGIITFDNVTGHRTISTTAGTGTSATLNEPNLGINDLLVGIITASGAWASSGGQSNYWSVWGNSCLASYKTGTGSTTLGWTGASGIWAAGGVTLEGGAGGPTAIAMFFKRYQDFMDRLRQGLIPQNQLEKEYGLVMSKMGSICQ